MSATHVVSDYGLLRKTDGGGHLQEKPDWGGQANTSVQREGSYDPSARDSAYPGTADTITAMRNRIRALIEIALQNGGVLSVNELSSLLPWDGLPSEQVLRQFIVSDEELGNDVTIIEEVVAPKGHEYLAALRSVHAERTRRRLERVRGLAAVISRRCPWARLVGVSGSTAYDTAKPEDDIDLFIVVDSRRAWITLLVAMLVARLERIRGRVGEPLCFNTVWEESVAETAFRSSEDPLFAREALSLKVSLGQDYYQDLLRSAPWMAHYFPRLYESRLAAHVPSGAASATRGNARWSILNLLALTVLAPYLWLTNVFRNWALEKTGRHDSRFETIVRLSSFSLKSQRFDKLRQQYAGLFRVPVSNLSGTRRKFISERYPVKVLADGSGVVLSLTRKKFSYLLFLSHSLVGFRKTRTEDCVVAKAGYDISRTVALIDEYYGSGGL